MILGPSGGNFAHLSTAALIARAEMLKMRAIELTWPTSVVETAEQILPLLRSAGVDQIVLNTFLFRSMVELESGGQKAFDDCVQVAQRLGAQFVLIYCPCGPRDQLDNTIERDDIDDYLAVVKQCSSRCAEIGATLVVENHPETLLCSAEATLDLLQRAETMGADVRLAFDAANFYNSAIEPYPLAYRLLRKYIAVLHVKEPARYHPALYGQACRVVRRTVNGVRIEHVFRRLGEGGMNWDGLMREMIQDGFRGPVILEPYTEREDLDAALEQSAEYLRARGAQ